MIFDLHNKDCLEILPTIPDKSIDLIFCDLPYGQTNCKWDSIIPIDKLWIEFKRIRKDTTPVIMTCTTKFGYKLIQSNEKEFKYDMVWQKSRKTGFLQARKRPLCNHEMVYFFYKKPPKYNYLKYHKYSKKKSTKLRKNDGQELWNTAKGFTNDQGTYEPTLPASVISGGNLYTKNDIVRSHDTYEPKLPASVIVNDQSPIKSWCEPDDKSFYGDELPDSILKIASKKPSKHSTSKPLALMEFILKYWTDENDIVFDPTFGGGSMPIQCKLMNRQFIGCEMDKKIYDDAVELINGKFDNLKI